MNTTYVVIRKVVIWLKLIFLGLSFCVSVKAEEARVPVPEGFQRLDFSGADQGVQTKESLAIINGETYRKIEYKSGVYYLKILTAESGDSTELICESEKKKLDPPRLIEGSVRMTKRLSLFMDGLQKTCAQSGAQKKIFYFAGLRLGLQIANEPKDLIKNKKIYVAPGTGLGFVGDW